MGLRVLLIGLWLLTSLPARGLAHPDLPVPDRRLTVAPGQEAEVPLSLHFHRLVGEVRATGDGPLQFALAGPDGARTPIAGPSPSGRLNHLVACCRDELYTPHRLVIRNAGPDPVTLDLQLHLVHDDLAVVALNGEPGATWQTGLFFLLLSAWMGLRTLRRGTASAPRPDPAPRRTALPGRGTTWALALFLIACAGGLGAGLLGVFAIGGGLVDGLVAAALLLPLPPGPFGSAGSVLMLLLMAPWAASLIIWTRVLPARAPGAGHPDRLTLLTGLVLAAGSLATATLLALRYGSLSPLVIAAFPVTALLAGVAAAGRARRPASADAR